MLCCLSCEMQPMSVDETRKCPSLFATSKAQCSSWTGGISKWRACCIIVSKATWTFESFRTMALQKMKHVKPCIQIKWVFWMFRHFFSMLWMSQTSVNHFFMIFSMVFAHSGSCIITVNLKGCQVPKQTLMQVPMALLAGVLANSCVPGERFDWAMCPKTKVGQAKTSRNASATQAFQKYRSSLCWIPSNSKNGQICNIHLRSLCFAACLIMTPEPQARRLPKKMTRCL